MISAVVSRYWRSCGPTSLIMVFLGYALATREDAATIAGRQQKNEIKQIHSSLPIRVLLIGRESSLEGVTRGVR
jgi:hypothetical protein